MDQNPYAPPRRDVVQTTFTSGGGTGEPRPWEIGEVISEAWGVFKLHWAPIIGAIVALYVVLIGVQLVMSGVLGAVIGRSSTPDLSQAFTLMGITVLAQQLVQAFLQVGLNRILLAAVRGQTPEFGLLFSGGNRYIVTLLSMFLFVIAMYAGMLLLVVPGIIIALGLANTMWFAADTELGVVETLKASWESMKGHKGKYFVFGLALIGLNLAVALALVVGLLVTVPVSLLAAAIIYTRVSGRTGEPVFSAAAAY